MFTAPVSWISEESPDTGPLRVSSDDFFLFTSDPDPKQNPDAVHFHRQDPDLV